uniref:Uncharacterized protein n=1 Tax=Anguilla anguilla TaxID=7936 RepID=A0A0E9TLI4_ANGAN
MDVTNTDMGNDNT